MAFKMSNLTPRVLYGRLASDVSTHRNLDQDSGKGPLAAGGEAPPHPNVDRRGTKGFKHSSKSLSAISWYMPVCRWVGTVVFVVLIFVILHDRERKDEGEHDRNFSAYQIRIFYFVMTGLILGLGLNWFEAFKESAKRLRKRIWDAKEVQQTVRDPNLIKGIENQLTVLKLVWKCLSLHTPRVWICMTCIAWILANLGAQIMVAVVTFTHEVVGGTSYNDTYFTDGMVLASNLTSYFNVNTSLSPENNQAMAHSWGEVIQNGEACGPYNDIAEVQSSQHDYPYFCRRTTGRQEFAYRFKEYNPIDAEKIYPTFTNRVLTVSSGVCFNYTVKDAENPQIYQDGSNYTFFNSSYSSSIWIPQGSDGWSATVYVYRGTDLPTLDESSRCGERCMWIWAYRAWGPYLTDTPTIFQCPITVSEVSNTTMDEQQIPDSVARVAAASIALSGRWTGNLKSPDWTQYQFNAFNTPWEVHGLPDDRASANMAEFALRSLVTMVEVNPSISLPGPVPHLGSHIEIRKNLYYGVLSGIIAAHFCLFVSVMYLTRKYSGEDLDDAEFHNWVLAERDDGVA